MIDPSEEITKEIPPEEIREQRRKYNRRKVDDVKEQLHSAAACAAQAGDALQIVYSKIAEALHALGEVNL